jgi:hypothetical protein
MNGVKMRHLCLVFFSLLVLLAAGCSDDDGPNGPSANPYRGDVNLNDISFEIADVVLFSKYLTEGASVFTIDEINQILATDFNGDGTTQSLADLVYGIRVVRGDAPPQPPTTPIAVNYRIAPGNRVAILDNTKCGAMRLVIQGQVTLDLLAPDMDMRYTDHGAYTSVLIYSLAGGTFTDDVVSFSGTLLTLELATAEGAPVIPVENNPPILFPVDQNYPNPFGPGTVDTSITFMAARATDYTVTIFNVMGVEVESIHGHTEAGICTIDLDLSGYESGIYFYRLEAQGVEFTRKLLVLQ